MPFTKKKKKLEDEEEKERPSIFRHPESQRGIEGGVGEALFKGPMTDSAPLDFSPKIGADEVPLRPEIHLDFSLNKSSFEMTETMLERTKELEERIAKEQAYIEEKQLEIEEAERRAALYEAERTFLADTVSRFDDIAGNVKADPEPEPKEEPEEDDA